MTTITKNKSFMLAGLLLLAKEAGKDIEDETLEHLQDTYPEAVEEVFILMMSMLTDALLQKGNKVNPLISAIDEILAA